jgi:zeta-carotene desaturase
MKNVLIIGGGLAGLSAAVYLSKNNMNVTLVEATHKLGGKTYSFIDENSKYEIDNGQHIILGCYQETIKYLRVISAFDKLKIPKEFSLNYLLPNFKIHRLKVSGYFYPFNLFCGFTKLELMDLDDKKNLLWFLLKIRFLDTEKIDNLNVKEWLELEKQTNKSVEIFWSVLCVGALNTSIENASAKLFCEVLKKIFWSNNNGYKFLLTENSLNDTFIRPAETFLLQHNVRIYKSEKVENVLLSGYEVKSVFTNKRKFDDYDFYIIAIPYHSIESLNLPSLKNLYFRHSSILNVYFWLDNNPFVEPYYALVNSEVHWIFNKGNYINITISNAGKFIAMSKPEIEEVIKLELEKFIPGFSKRVIKSIIVKEKKATFIPDNQTINKRPSTRTSIKNLFLAGDWTDTKLPATIEGAIKSGRMAAESVINFQHY